MGKQVDEWIGQIGEMAAHLVACVGAPLGGSGAHLALESTERLVGAQFGEHPGAVAVQDGLGLLAEALYAIGECEPSQFTLDVTLPRLLRVAGLCRDQAQKGGSPPSGGRCLCNDPLLPMTREDAATVNQGCSARTGQIGQGVMATIARESGHAPKDVCCRLRAGHDGRHEGSYQPFPGFANEVIRWD